MAPTTTDVQDECYCNTSYCGAGMLDAGAAVAASVAGPLARIDLGTPTPTAGVALTLSGTGSTAAAGSTLSTYAWALPDTGGIVTAFTSAVNADTATLTPSAAGSFTVQLTVTDDLGRSDVVTRVVTVAAAPGPDNGGNGGDGGGAFSWLWVLGVLSAAGVLRAPVHRAQPGRRR